MRWMVLALGVTILGCSPPDQESAEGGDEGATRVASTDGAHADHRAAEDSGAMDHAAHQPSGAAAQDEHAGHAAPAAAARGHEGHAATPAAGADAHAGHEAHAAAPAAGADTHAGHEAAARAPADAAHAAHVAAADTSHVAQPAADGAQHMAHAEADTSHMAHPARADTTHAAHAAAADTGHTAHAAPAQHAGAHGTDTAGGREPMGHEMAMISLGDGWMAIGMAQAFPTATVALPSDDGTPLDETGLYVTQPALMLNIESPQSRVSFRTTLNFEGLTQPDGELTFGGWGEGFLDKRHPHTYLHEAMLSVNVWARDGGGFSLSAGKGFAPFGTDDPMSRPVIKYPTNHHLSQILERWTLNAVYSSPRWSVEAGAFGGNEPTSPTDMSNIESFANSASARVARRFGTGAMGVWEWELSGSYGYVVEEHDAEESATQLYNLAFRHEHEHTFAHMYYLVEASLSDPEHHAGYWSLLGEGSLMMGAHNPYGRVEYATRPEYPRDGPPGTADFFRYDHDDEPIGATRWLTLVAGYGFTATSLPFSARPYVEAQWNRVSEEEGGIDPDALFGRSSFFSLSAGFRLFLGGEPMRMGSYGVLDSMTLMHRMMMGEAPGAEHDAH